MTPSPSSASTQTRDGLTVRTIRGLAEIPALEEAWRSFQTHPWSDVDYYLEILARQGEFVRPHILILEREGRPVGLVAGHVRSDALPWKIGSFTLGRSRARLLWVGAGGVTGETSAAAAGVIVGELSAALARGEADAAYLHQIDATSPLGAELQRAPRLTRDRGARASGGWLLELPGSYGDFLSSRTKSVRRHIKRYSQALERELGTELVIVCHREAGALERLVDDSEAVARQTYHRKMLVGFEDTPEVRRFFAHALSAGWMRGYVLYARGRPIAFWHGLVYRGTLFTRDTGYDPSCAALRPGQYLLNKVIEELCRTREVERVDYGVMELDYKRNFGSRRYERTSVYLFSRRPKGLVLSTLRSASALAERVARRVLGGRARAWARKLASLGRRGPKAGGQGAQGEVEPAEAD